MFSLLGPNILLSTLILKHKNFVLKHSVVYGLYIIHFFSVYTTILITYVKITRQTVTCFFINMLSGYLS